VQTILVYCRTCRPIWFRSRRSSSWC